MIVYKPLILLALSFSVSGCIPFDGTNPIVPCSLNDTINAITLANQGIEYHFNANAFFDAKLDKNTPNVKASADALAGYRGFLAGKKISEKRLAEQDAIIRETLMCPALRNKQ
jgi:hypothetical protein